MTPLKTLLLTHVGQPLLIAMQFLTRVPMPDIGRVDDPVVGRSLLWYPVVGLFFGVVLWLLQLFMQLLFPDLWSIQAALLLLVWSLLSGGLHLDGLADSADAWAGGLGDPERTLALMKDPRCGPAAVMVLVLVLLLKWAALEALLQQHPALLVLAPVIARAMLLLLFLTTPYVRPSGIGEALAEHFPRRSARYLLAGGVLLLLLVSGLAGLLVLCCCLLLFFGLRRLMIRRIGGTTGDTAGALVELAEVAVLLALVAGS